MDTARLLKSTANLLMGACAVRLVARDLRNELRRAPYGTAGAAAALGLLTGFWVGHRRRLRAARP